jgi:hypothetical protein
MHTAKCEHLDLTKMTDEEISKLDSARCYCDFYGEIKVLTCSECFAKIKGGKQFFSIEGKVKFNK